MLPITVALCDDNTLFRESLEGFLADTPGLNLAYSLPSAVDLPGVFAGAPPDVVLMDIDMPGTDGITATARIKASFPGVNVLMLTVYEDEQKIFDAILSGASGYLLKKTPPQKIVDAIQDVHSGGGSMSAAVVRKVLNFFSSHPVAQEYDLSAREGDILQCLVNGDSYKMIAAHCGISMGTVRSHINNIYKKLHINSKSEAVAKAIRERLVRPTGAPGN